MSGTIHQWDFPNGLHLLVDPMPGVQSAAFTLLVPGGVVRDPPMALGSANLLADLVLRGAGLRDSRAVTRALDALGLQRGESTEIFHTSFQGATLARNLLPALEIMADVICRPHLDEEELDSCKAGTLQDLKAVDDDPTQKLFIELRRRSLPGPLGRPILGTEEHVRGVERETVVGLHERTYRPNGTILGVAGAVDFPTIRDGVARLFDAWPKRDTEQVTVGTIAPTRFHIESDKAQTHIGIAFPSVPYGDPDFFNAHGAVGILSGGMSSRLFTEVREKRGLCYTVSASYYALRDLGVILCHSGTTNERASETLEVILAELRRLRDGIRLDEVRRVQAGLKSSLIMQEESTSARSSVIARSWFNLGRVRTLEEVAAEIDALSPESILGYLDRHPPESFTIVTLGPNALEKVA